MAEASKPSRGLTVFSAPQAILPGSVDPQPATILVDRGTGKIVQVIAGKCLSKGELSVEESLGSDEVNEWVQVDETKVLIPGLVDAHVHLNQPGRTEWEGFSTGTLAAISGGVTTVVDMPLNSIPSTTSVGAFNVKIKSARYGWENEVSQQEAKKLLEDSTSLESCRNAEVSGARLLDVLGPAESYVDGDRGGVFCDVAFWGGVVPGNQNDLVPLLKAGVRGFKGFLIDSGVDDFPAVEEEDVRKAFAALEGTNGLILFHAEQGDCCQVVEDQSYKAYLASRPDEMEVRAIKTVIRVLDDEAKKATAATVPTRAHIVHLGTGQAIPVISDARQRGLPLTIETCFHYLVLSAESVPDNGDHHHTEYKCAPPIRQESTREELWQALEAGLIDYVVSDHSPCVAELKQGGFMEAWGGVSGLGLGASLMWTEMLKRNEKKAQKMIQGEKLGLGHLVKWCCTNTAKQVGLKDQKGLVKVGADADFALFDPNVCYEVTTQDLKFKNKLSPYIGKQLQGRVCQTYLRGRLVYDAQQGGQVGPRTGRLI